MPLIRVNAHFISIDGFGAGPGQSLQHPLGKGGERMTEWMFHTDTFQKMIGKEGGSHGVDEQFASASMKNVGAWVMGRNMFAPSRGPWPTDDPWKGWWGDVPPYHVPVFVLTHHPRADLPMDGGTTFHFVTGGLDEAIRRAREAAGGKDVRIGGGVATIRQCLERGLIDTMHIAVAPVLLGQGEALFAGLDLPSLGYKVVRRTEGEKATHLEIERTA